jgi:two-component sensor histidine kinase
LNTTIPDRSAIDVAYHSAKDLLELIGDILDIARIESGHLSLSPERVNLEEIVASVVRIFDGLARQKALELLLEFDSVNPATDVLLDPLRFKQVLSNLVSNAIKFTEQGQVRIVVRLQPGPEADQVDMMLQVEDSGIGISEEDQQRLFEPFAQADATGQSGRGGAGLGLVISRSLCEMMGGNLQLSSQPGKGTKVQMSLRLPTLPREPQVEKTATDPLDTASRPLTCPRGRRSCGQPPAHVPATGVSGPSLPRCGGWSGRIRGVENRHVRSGDRRLQHAGHEWLRVGTRHSPTRTTPATAAPAPCWALPPTHSRKKCNAANRPEWMIACSSP